MAATTRSASPLLRRVLPAQDEIDALSPDGRRTLLDWYALDSPRHVRLTMIATLDGRAAGPDGTSESLTSRIDRTVLGVIRESCDAVLVGAETLRREPGLVPRARPLVVLSASGDLGAIRPPMPPRDDRPAPPVMVMTTPRGEARVAAEHPWIESLVIDTRDDHLALPVVLDTLHERGLSRITAEGGPSLAGALVRERLVDELCLTIAPRLGGHELSVLGQASSASEPRGPVLLSAARLQHLMVDDDGALYGRWSLTRADETA